MEIEKVLTLYRELAKCEEKLAALRVVTIPTARADTPPIQRTSQPTERIAVDILALEEEKTRLLAELNETKAGLALQILDTVTNPAIAQILIRRYVRRETFKQIATANGFATSSPRLEKVLRKARDIQANSNRNEILLAARF